MICYQLRLFIYDAHRYGVIQTGGGNCHWVAHLGLFEKGSLLKIHVFNACLHVCD